MNGMLPRPHTLSVVLTTGHTIVHRLHSPSLFCIHLYSVKYGPCERVDYQNSSFVSGLLTLGQFCPGERVSSFSCTTELVHVWSGSALDGQCPVINDVIILSTSLDEGDTVPCGIFTANVTNITSVTGGNSLLSSTISFTASSDLDGTQVVCTDGNQAEVERYPIMIIGEWITYM